MAYLALKPCSFAGQSFKIGENIPADLVLPGAADNLVKMGIIAGEDAQPAREETITIVVGGDMELRVTHAGLQAVFDVLNGTATAAEDAIEAMIDGEALILLHYTDNRKTVKELAEARAKEISEE